MMSDKQGTRPLQKIGRKDRRKARREEWDSLCIQCGLCCYRKEYRHGRMMINLNRPCNYLDVESRLCMVYENRFKICSDCRKVTLYHAFFSSLMPEECGYVQKYRKWKFLVQKPGITPRRACQVAVVWALTDDLEVQRSIEEVVTSIFEE